MNQAALDIVGDFLWDSEFARTVDDLTTSQCGIPARVLMELAGRAVADAVRDLSEDDDEDDGASATPIIVLAGPGNNGADAIVAARWLHAAGRQVHTYLVVDSEATKRAPLLDDQLRTARASGLVIDHYKRGALGRFKKAEPVIIDGVFGIGLTRPVGHDSLAASALKEAANIADTTVVAIDIPSGLDANSGHSETALLPADLTITFGGKKLAHVLAPARDLAGEVVVVDIGFPARVVNQVQASKPSRFVVPDGRELLLDDPWSKLKRSAHKYDRGHVLVIGGSAGKTGAPLLAAMSALRSGAGWVSVSMPDSAMATLRGDVPRELVFEQLFRGDELNSLALAKFIAERKVRAVVIGPGMMQNPLTPAVMTELAAFSAETGCMMVLDAGATHGTLPMLRDGGLVAKHWLLTPHPGEWQRLAAPPPPPPLSRRDLEAAQQVACELGVTLLYKHATPVVVTGDQELPAFVLTDGTQALARAGSGDLLAGAAAAHGALGLSATLSVLRAQTVIAWAARLAEKRRGPHGVLAQDILACMGQVTDVAAEAE
ncbi:MAG: NAD(P)H-hydrate dehydratase [Deltaproteobacteria bacterium]|nr:NAD(P)H-hydrate dehydratase [Deltaproteobacteria bacterium]